MIINPCKDCGSTIVRTIHIDAIDNEDADVFAVRCCTCRTEIHGHTLEDAVERWNNRLSLLEKAMHEAMRQLDERKMVVSSTIPITVEQVEALLKEPIFFPAEFKVKTMEIPQEKRHCYDGLEPLYLGRLALAKFYKQSAEAEENKTGG